jgi:alkylation response protein AidB-like acyl-CoA dehydrogenase
MGMTGTERQQHFIELAATHAEDFKTRVTQHDRENTFPFENVKAMKDSGYTNMTMPAELGGGGVNVLDFALAQERLAQSDGPMAVAINMHLLTIGIVADLWRLGDQKLRPFLERIAQERLIVAAGTNDPRMSSSIGLGGLIDTTRRAEKVDGGYVINGRAGFGTMSACADFLGQTAHYDDPEQGPRCLLFFVPTNTPGIHLQTNWDTLSIRASASNDIVWENVFVPEQDVMVRPARTMDPVINLLISWFTPSVGACYLGIAQAARDYAVTWASQRTQVPFDRPQSHYPHNQFLAAEMEVGLRAARAMVVQTASALSEPAVRANPPLMDVIACHQFGLETASSVVDKAMRLVGGAALFRSSPLEQMYRDTRAAILHQPFAGYDGRGWLGKLVFGIPPDTMPRWV